MVPLFFFTFYGIIFTLRSTNITCDCIFVIFDGSLFLVTFYSTSLTLYHTNITCDYTFITFGSSLIFFSHILWYQPHIAQY